MSTTAARLLSLTALLLPLAGCGGGLFGESSPPAPHVYADVPQAAELTDENAQELYLIVVQNLRKEGQSHAALAYLDDYDNRFPEDPQAQLLRADLLVDVGRAVEAETIYRAFLDEDALAPNAYAGLGHVAAETGDWRGAENAFAQAVSRQPINAKYLNALGFAQLMNSDFRSAVFSLRKANELAPNTPTFRNNLVLALRLGGQDAEAARLVQGIVDPQERQAAERMLAVSPTELGVQSAPQPAPPLATTPAPATPEVPEAPEVAAAEIQPKPQAPKQAVGTLYGNPQRPIIVGSGGILEN